MVFTHPPPSLAGILGHPLLSQALKELERLPPQQYCTGWVLHQVGRAHFERADYANAKVLLMCPVLSSWLSVDIGDQHLYVGARGLVFFCVPCLILIVCVLIPPPPPDVQRLSLSGLAAVLCSRLWRACSGTIPTGWRGWTSCRPPCGTSSET